MRDPGLLHVGVRATELFHRHVLPGDGLDDVGAGDEHLTGAIDHDHEIGQRWGVDVSAGGGAHDHRDLRDHPGGADVAVEDLPVQPEGDHPFLDAGPGTFVDAHQRPSGLDRQVHHLDDLLAVDLPQTAAEDGRVLGEHAHIAAVDRAVAGDDTVTEGAIVTQPEIL